MRTIKFRAKRIDNGEWVYGHYLQIGDKHFISCNAFPCEVDESTLGQFTGSSNAGEEFCEGDIIFDNRSEENGEIYYDESAFYVRHSNVIELLSEMKDDIFIIGNVTDNKELLS